MRVRDPAVDCLDAVDRKNVAGRLARELVGTVAGADGNRQGVELRSLHEVGGLIGIGQQHFLRHRDFSAMTVFLVAAHRFERAQTAELAFDADTLRVRHVDYFFRHLPVVVVVGDGLAVFAQRAVHHHR